MTSGKRSRSVIASLAQVLLNHKPQKSAELRSVKWVSEALVECLETGDMEAFREVLAAHMLTVNKSKLAADSGLGRRTIYDLLDPDKEFNPSLQTVSALLRGLAS